MVSSARSPDLSSGDSHGRLTPCRSAERPAAGRWSARQVAPPAERAAAGRAAPMRHYNLGGRLERPVSETVMKWPCLTPCRALYRQYSPAQLPGSTPVTTFTQPWASRSSRHVRAAAPFHAEPPKLPHTLSSVHRLHTGFCMLIPCCMQSSWSANRLFSAAWASGVVAH